MSRPVPAALRLAAIWVIYAVWSSAAGWLLSLAGALTPAGYALAALPGIAAAAAVWHATRPAGFRPAATRRPRFLREIRRSRAFAAWLFISLLILAGSMAHPPSNYDGLTYRLPRLLYWLQEHRWFWIGGIDFRMDIAGTGFEWMAGPLIAATGTDRAMFLLNFVPFLLLPALFFLAARSLGIPARSAKWWMWVWPLAFGVALQAGSTGNDMVGAGLALASLAFAAEARHHRPVLFLALSALAAAAMSGIKVTLLPLGLPLLFVWLWHGLKCLPPARLAAAGLLAAPLAMACSFLPMAYQCWHQTGTWTANPGNRLGIEVESPWAGLAGNGFDFAVGAIYPPVFPVVGMVNREVIGRLEPQPWYRRIQELYPSYDARLQHELPTEEGAGLGIGVTLLIIAWWLRRTPAAARSRTGLLFAAATVVSTLAFMAKAGGDSAPRMMVAFTPFFVLSLLGVAPVVRLARNSWLALLPTACLLPGLVLNPNRPLVSPGMVESLPGLPATLKSRLATVYRTYTARSEILAPFRELVPADETVGFAGDGDHSPVGLFRPFGNRQVADYSGPRMDQVRWVVGTPAGIERRTGQPLAEWEEKSGFKRVTERVIVSRVSTGPETWILYSRSAGR